VPDKRQLDHTGHNGLQQGGYSSDPSTSTASDLTCSRQGALSMETYRTLHLVTTQVVRGSNPVNKPSDDSTLSVTNVTDQCHLGSVHIGLSRDFSRKTSTDSVLRRYVEMARSYWSTASDNDAANPFCNTVLSLDPTATARPNHHCQLMHLP